MWIAACPRRLLWERRNVLPSIATTPEGAPVSATTHATKHCWNFAGSSTARISPI